jgi:hypothetical protein
LTTVVVALWPLLALGQPAARPREVGKAEMADFAAAARRVHQLWQEAEAPVSSEVRQRMVEAIQEEGLDLETYNRIARGIRGHDELYERYQQRWNRLE